jgi:hypothetical protein
MLQPSYDHSISRPIRADSAVMAQQTTYRTEPGDENSRATGDDDRHAPSVYAAWWAY